MGQAGLEPGPYENPWCALRHAPSHYRHPQVDTGKPCMPLPLVRVGLGMPSKKDQLQVNRTAHAARAVVYGTHVTRGFVLPLTSTLALALCCACCFLPHSHLNLCVLGVAVSLALCCGVWRGLQGLSLQCRVEELQEQCVLQEQRAAMAQESYARLRRELDAIVRARRPGRPAGGGGGGTVSASAGRDVNTVGDQVLPARPSPASPAPAKVQSKVAPKSPVPTSR